MIRLAVRRLRRSSGRELVQVLRPKRIDFLLYQLAPSDARTDVAVADDVVIQRFTPENPSSFRAIDARLTEKRHCYAVILNGTVAHQSWLFGDLILLAQFGFDPEIPVIGECDTPPAFRGMRLYPRALQYIAQDVFRRGVADRLYMWVAPDNILSIRGIERAGFSLTARLRGFKLAGLLVYRKVDRYGE
ncbi:MAG: hypothetical protein OER90_03890 [Gemmatimonadota bacterium]|nr:hypothetical protein [Gemmatimonadota bacterium]